MSREAREAEATLGAKQTAMTEHDRTFGDVATLLSALYKFAGSSDLADEVRPSARRPGRVAEDGDPVSRSVKPTT